MSIDPTLEQLFKAACIGRYSWPIDLVPLRVLGDYYEEHGHMIGAEACRISRPLFWGVPLLSYLESLGFSTDEATDIRIRWEWEA